MSSATEEPEQIFLSYSRKDSAAVNQLRDLLRVEGFDVWMDEEDISVGSFRAEIADAIQNCRVFLWAGSRNSLKSDFVRHEVDVAAHLRKPIQAIYVEDPELVESRLHGVFLHELAGKQWYYLDPEKDPFPDGLRRALIYFGVTPRVPEDTAETPPVHEEEMSPEVEDPAGVPTNLQEGREFQVPGEKPPFAWGNIWWVLFAALIIAGVALREPARRWLLGDTGQEFPVGPEENWETSERFWHYQIVEGDTVERVAAKLQVEASLLRELNHLAEGVPLAPGDWLWIPKSDPRGGNDREAGTDERFQPNPGDLHLATSKAPFENSLGMTFVPVEGTGVLFSVYETRVSEFRAFHESGAWKRPPIRSAVLATGRKETEKEIHWDSPGFAQSEMHPVTLVSWMDAKAFCDWLSREEKLSYRLPTDWEWSLAAGLEEDAERLPRELDRKKAGWPWGTSYPTSSPVGNYADEEIADVYPFTSEVGRFPPNLFGIYDLGGNVWEWCADWYDVKRDTRTLRGCSWYNFSGMSLRSSARNAELPDTINQTFGFRCVIELVPEGQSSGG